MTEWYKAITMKEIFWNGETYKSGSEIKLIKEDVRILDDAGIIGSIKKIEIQESKEFAIKSIPENQKKDHKRGRKPRNQNESFPGLGITS